MNYLTLYGQTIFDLTINTINDFDNVYGLILSNPVLKNIESLPVGVEIIYTPPPVTPPVINSQVPQDTITSKDYFSSNNQTVYDIVLQTYSDLDFTYKLIEDSNFSNIQTYPVPTSLFKFNPQLIANNSLINYLNKNGLIINTRTDFISNDTNFLLQDDGFFLLQDDGSKIIWK